MRVQGESRFSGLKEYVRGYVSRAVPGMLTLLDVVSRLATSVDAISLLFSSPSKLYQVTLFHYRDMCTADIVFKLLFVNPIASYLGNHSLAEELLHLAKVGRDREFLEVIEKRLAMK